MTKKRKFTMTHMRILMMYFITYAIIGWLYETFIWIFKENQIINRGFLYGPWLPIYGFGGLILYITLYKYAITPHYTLRYSINIKPMVVFLIISASSALIELVSTFIMDAVGFDFKQLWHYDEYAINFQQRIALIPAIQFGILGVIILYKAQPYIDKFIRTRKYKPVRIQKIIILCFIIDVVIHIFTGSTYNDIPLLIL